MSQLIAGTPIAYVSATLAVVLLLLIMGPALPSTGARSAGTSKRRLILVQHEKIDRNRSVVLIRRDGVEHLLLTGGPQDIVVETFAAPQNRHGQTTDRALREQDVKAQQRPPVARSRPIAPPTGRVAEKQLAIR